MFYIILIVTLLLCFFDMFFLSFRHRKYYFTAFRLFIFYSHSELCNINKDYDDDYSDSIPGQSFVPVLLSRSTLILDEDDEFLLLEPKEDKMEVLPCLLAPEKS